MGNKRGLFRRALCFVCALLLVAGCAMPAFASRGKPYTYMVRLYAGQQGTVGGKDMQVYDNIAYGSRLSFNINDVELLDDSKYYVKGFRESGKGTEEVQGIGTRLATFTVTEDIDYVVAYGLRGTMVDYTVNYQDANGNTLAPSETYTGNVGDRPVVAYLYIEGYQPQAYNLTKTLVEDPAENVLTFVYTRVTPTVVPGGTDVIIQPGPGAVVVPAAPTPTPAPGGEAEAPTPTPEGDEGGEATPAPTEPPVNVPEQQVPAAQPEAPVELVDVDTGEVPLAQYQNDKQATLDTSLNEEGKVFWDTIPLWAKILGGAVLLGAIATVLWFLLLYRRDDDREEEVIDFPKDDDL